MTVDACAELVRRGDPDRFLAVMAAPPAARARLFPLYAFNLEVARAPWVTKEPLIAEMRLQWWRDVVDNAGSGAARAHEVAGPLHELIRACALSVVELDALIVARRWDIHAEPHDGEDGIDDYLEDSGAGLMWLAAQVMDAPAEAETAVRAYGWAAAAATYLCAVPKLEVRGKHPLPVGVSPTDLARKGLQKLARARAARASVPRSVAPALLSGWQAEAILKQVLARQVEPGLSEFSRRRRLLWQAFSGRW